MAFATLAVAVLATAQIHVHPGDPLALQAAIDAAPPGATILVHGGTYEPIVIDKPLDLVAEPRATIANPPQTSFGPVPTAIRLEGPGSGRVTVQNFRTDGWTSPDYTTGALPRVAGGGFDELWILDSRMTEPQVLAITGGLTGVPAVETDVKVLVVCRSVLTPIDTQTSKPPAPPDMPAGIHAPSSTVVLSQSTVRGGDGPSLIYSAPMDCIPEPATIGGIGVVCQRLFVTDSSVSGGAGSTWSCYPSGLSGQHPEGQAMQVVELFQLPYNLQAFGPPRLGQDWVLGKLSSEPSVAVFSTGMLAPYLDPVFGPIFVDPVTLVHVVLLYGDPVGWEYSVFSVTVPDEPALVGLEVVVQLFEPYRPRVGGPVFGQVR